MQRKYRLTYSYFLKFAKPLRQRADYKKFFEEQGGAFYSVYGVSTATFAPHKVVWRDMGSIVQAAVISRSEPRGAIPEHHVMFVATRSEDEAHFSLSVRR